MSTAESYLKTGNILLATVANPWNALIISHRPDAISTSAFIHLLASLRLDSTPPLNLIKITRGHFHVPGGIFLPTRNWLPTTAEKIS